MTLLHDAFAAVARARPEARAVEWGNEALSYGELDALANRFARTFLERGVGPGRLVGIHLPRSGRGIAAMLGALRAGAAYVPLDPGSPPQRMQLIAADCGLEHVVIAPPLLAAWKASGLSFPVEHYVLSAEASDPEVPGQAALCSWAELSAASADPVAPSSARPDDLAYILYTSGSTGVPKGVMLSHTNALAFTQWAADTIELAASDRVASVAPFHFDLSVFDVWSSLSRGAAIVVVDEVTVLNGRRMLDRIHAAGISVWYSVPSALVLMLEVGGLEERGAPSLRAVYFAGEVFPMKHLRRVMAALPGARFFNLFGPTETNVCLAYALPGIPSPEATSIPIGRPSCGDTARILDEQGREAADGEIGELFIEGPTVMMGYWNGGKPIAAAHPYPTGDMVERRADGEIMYHGRRDHMVKIHGYRVELGEVEAALNAHPAIGAAVAFAVEQRLVAVVIPRDADLSVLAVKRHCADHLPRYMIPADIRLVARLPSTSNGKIDRVGTQNAVISGDAALLPPVSRRDP